ncbi:hypothetical protein P781_12970 [Vibrio mimicus CAIM 1883]|nr:hypothetical protein P780_12950 [Vibrio mimicus CAIM 1882]ERM54832.1 hypothetical protein P781_12970 [Vibrio mimicus CAIM 1883]
MATLIAQSGFCFNQTVTKNTLFTIGKEQGEKGASWK